MCHLIPSFSTPTNISKQLTHIQRLRIDKFISISIPNESLCDKFCIYSVQVYEDYVYHMRKDHDFVPYVAMDCQYCEKMFRTQKTYDWHMKNTHGENHQCPKCEFMAPSKHILK